MNNIIESPQNIFGFIIDSLIKIFTLLIEYLSLSINNLINTLEKSANNSTYKDTILNITTIIKKFMINIVLFTKSINTMSYNTINEAINVETIESRFYMDGDSGILETTNNPSRSFNILLKHTGVGFTNIPVENGYEMDININLLVGYYLWVTDDDSNKTIKRQCVQILKYRFFFNDPQLIGSASSTSVGTSLLNIVPELIDFEDHTPFDINGTKVPSPLQDITLKLKYVYEDSSSNVTKTIIYDPLDSSISVPSTGKITQLQLSVIGKLDTIKLSGVSNISEKIKIRSKVHSKKTSIDV